MKATINYVFGNMKNFQVFLCLYSIFAVIIPLATPFFLSGSKNVLFGWLPTFMGIWVLSNWITIVIYGVVLYRFVRARKAVTQSIPSK